MNNQILKHLNELDIKEVLEITQDKDALIFDMDGTVLNSEVLHFQAIEKITSNKSNYTIDDLYGVADTDVFDLIKNHIAHDLTTFLHIKNNLMLEIIPKSKTTDIIKDSMITLLKEIKKRNKKLALVTASESIITKALLEHCGVYQLFDFVLTRQDTKQTKPHPEPYQNAINLLGFPKEKVIVFEDSPTGIQASTSAGLDTIKVSWYENKK